MFSRNRIEFFYSESIKFIKIFFLLKSVNFIYCIKNRFSYRSEDIYNLFVKSRKSFFTIKHQYYHISIIYSIKYLGANLIGKNIIITICKSTSIYQCKFNIIPHGFTIMAIPCNSWEIIDKSIG